MPRTALIASGVLHAGVLVFLIVGLPERPREFAVASSAIDVEIVADTAPEAPTPAATAPKPERVATRTADPTPPRPKPPEPVKPAEVTPPPPPPRPPEPEAAEPKRAEAPLIVPAAPSKPKPPAPKRAEPQLAAATPDPPKPKKPDPPKKQAEPPPENDLDAILKSVERLDPRKYAATERAGTGNAVSPEGAARTGTEGVSLSASEIALVRRQVEEHWSIPAGVQGVADMRVKLRIQLGQDGAVQAVDIQDAARSASDPVFRTVAESARRAVLAASPLTLPPEKYALWRDMILVFDPPLG